MAPPRRVGRYALGEVLGVGSFSTVHRAVDEWLDDIVVVKVLAENHSLNPEVRERFIAEGRSLRRVRSPHVIGVHDIGETDLQQPYLVLEHADGGTLAERVATLRASGWTATVADALAVARALAAALDVVHAAQLVHRDLSPGNVLLRAVPADVMDPDTDRAQPGVETGRAAGSVVGADEQLVLADLGMCKDLARSSGLTVAGGTEGFRPPEQRGGPTVIDARADLWSLSALMSWLCEGADLPSPFTEALRRGLATEADHRHDDIAGWLADVEAALGVADGPPAGDDAAGAGDDGDRRPSVWGRSLTVWLLAVLALGVGVAAGAIGVQWLADDDPPAQADGASVAITGPATMSVGAEATFDAAVEGLDTWVWTLPTGGHVLDEERVTIEARTAGNATVSLRAVAGDGTELETEHRITVTE